MQSQNQIWGGGQLFKDAHNFSKLHTKTQKLQAIFLIGIQKVKRCVQL